MGLKPLKLGDKTPPLGPAIVQPLAARGGGASAGAAVGRRASMSSSALVGNGAARVHPHAGEMNGGSPGGASSPHSPGSPHSFNHHHHKHHHHHEGARSPSLGLGASDDPLREAKRMPELVGGTEGCDADGDEDAWRVRLDFAAAQVLQAILMRYLLQFISAFKITIQFTRRDRDMVLTILFFLLCVFVHHS